MSEPKKQPPTHILLSLQVRDAMMKDLAPLPFGQVIGIYEALRTAPEILPRPMAKAVGPPDPPAAD